MISCSSALGCCWTSGTPTSRGGQAAASQEVVKRTWGDDGAGLDCGAGFAATQDKPAKAKNEKTLLRRILDIEELKDLD